MRPNGPADLLRNAAALVMLGMLLLAPFPHSPACADPQPSSALTIPEAQLERLTAATETPWAQTRAVVLFFVGTECPVSNSYAPAMQRLADDYAARGVVVVLVYAEPDVSEAQAGRHAAEYRLRIPRLLDPEQALASRCAVGVVPTAVVAAPQGRVIYRGRIDNRYSSLGKRRDAATRHELRDALEAALRGELPTVRETTPFGCPLPAPRIDRQVD